jgi:MFS family permease
VVIFEIPTGYLCDLFGRKISLVIGSFLCGIGFTFLNFVKTYPELVMYEIVIALALSFVSGADVSLLYDSIIAEEDEQQRRLTGTKALANMQFFSVFGESTAAIFGGLLVGLSFHHVTFANAIAGWMPFLISLTVVEVNYEKMQRHSHWKNFKQVIQHLFKNDDPLLFLVFINLVIWGLSTFFAVWMLQKYWEDDGIPLAYFGVIWAAYNLTVGIAGKQVHWLEDKLGPKKLLILMGLSPIIAYVGMGLSGGIAAIMFGFFFYFCRGINHVLLKDAMNWRIPAQFRATANSLQSFFFRLGFALLGPLVGYSVDQRGMRFTLIALGVSFVVLFCAALIPLVLRLPDKKIHA